MDGRHIGTSKLLLRRIDPLQLNLPLFVIQVIRQRTECAISEQ
jgi:hypothetical protein